MSVDIKILKRAAIDGVCFLLERSSIKINQIEKKNINP